jgi:hypothetical protein
MAKSQLDLGRGVPILLALVLVAVAAVVRFGWLDGFAILAAVYLLMPWPPTKDRSL